MQTIFRYSFLLLFLVSCSAAGNAVVHEEPVQPTSSSVVIETTSTAKHHIDEEVFDRVVSILGMMPVDHPDQLKVLHEALSETGSQGLRVLAGLLAPSGTGTDAPVRYALSSYTVYVSRPGAYQERQAFEQAMLEIIQGSYAVDVKTFLMEQLSLAATNASVPVVEGFLTHERLYKPALDLLETLATPQAALAVRRAYPDATGAPRLAMIRILGDLGDRASLPLIREDALSEHENLQMNALSALVALADINAVETFSEALAQTEGHRHDRVVYYHLSYADALAHDGQGSAAAAIARPYLEQSHSSQIRTAALNVLFAAEGGQMLETLMDLAVSGDKRVAYTALMLAAGLPGGEVTNALASRASQAPVGIRADFDSVLAQRRGQTADSGSVPTTPVVPSERIPVAMDEPMSKFGVLFNGQNLNGWDIVGANVWHVENGILYNEGRGGGWLATDSVYGNFELDFEFRMPVDGNSGVFIRAPREGNPAYQGMEVQLLDDYADMYAQLRPYQFTGSLYDLVAPSQRVTKQAGEWQHMVIRADGPIVSVILNGQLTVHANLIEFQDRAQRHPGVISREGYIGFQAYGAAEGRVEFRNVVIRPIPRVDE